MIHTVKIATLALSMLVHPVDWLDDVPAQVGIYGCVRVHPPVTAWRCPAQQPDADQGQAHAPRPEGATDAPARRERHGWNHRHRHVVLANGYQHR